MDDHGKGPTFSSGDLDVGRMMTWCGPVFHGLFPNFVHLPVKSPAKRGELSLLWKLLSRFWFLIHYRIPLDMTFPFFSIKTAFFAQTMAISCDAMSKGGDEHITLKAVKDRFGLSAEIWAGELREVEGCHPAMYGPKLGKSIQQKTPRTRRPLLKKHPLFLWVTHHSSW